MNETGYLSRLDQLTDDNAFVHVQDVLRHKGVGTPSSRSSARDSTFSFLNLEEVHQKPLRSGVADIGVRVNITGALSEQHSKFLSWLSDHGRKPKRSSLFQRDYSVNGRGKKERRLKFDDMEEPLNLSTEEGCACELERERRVLEAWKYSMIHGNQGKIKGPSSSPSFQKFIEVHTTCPSFEAMTAPRIRRSPKCQYFLQPKKKSGFLFGSRKFVPLGALHHKVCSVCLLPSSYKCVRCQKAFFCSMDCHHLHDATRCLKFTV